MDFTGSNTWAENFRNRNSFGDARGALPPPTMTQALTAPADDPTAGPSMTPAGSPLAGPTSLVELTAMVSRLEQNGDAMVIPESALVVPALPPLSAERITSEAARQSAFIMASFIQQNPDRFTVAEQLTFERGYREKVSQIVIDEMKAREVD